jgi:hypothetical protein
MAPNRPQTLIGFNVRKRVIRDISTVGRPLPVFPHKRTFSRSVGMSQKCQQAT